MKWSIVIMAFTVVSANVILNPREYADKYPNILEHAPILDYQELEDVTLPEEFAVDPSRNEYWLYTRSNPTTPLVLIPNDNEFLKAQVNVSKAIVVLVHGWTADGLSPVNKQLTYAFLQTNDVNVIVLDWSHLAQKLYIIAKVGVPIVGKALAQFIERLSNIGASYDKMHVVGHSLGAHVVGYAGKTTEGKIRRITGLDPAGPFWDIDKNRLHSGDAQYVEIIHTNTGHLGINLRCGDADFYPNGGTHQPGCSTLDNSCSHSRSYEYMASSIIYNRFLANECDTMDDLKHDNCTGPVDLMGNDDLNKTRSGIFMLKTGMYYPYWNTT